MLFKLASITQFGVIPPTCPFRRDGSHIHSCACYYYDTIFVAQITSENEANIMRLTEQAKVLKEEIRRLERNHERQNAISNMEYLKNVVMKVSHDKIAGLDLLGVVILKCYYNVINNFSAITNKFHA